MTTYFFSIAATTPLEPHAFREQSIMHRKHAEIVICAGEGLAWRAGESVIGELNH